MCTCACTVLVVYTMQVCAYNTHVPVSPTESAGSQPSAGWTGAGRPRSRGRPPAAGTCGPSPGPPRCSSAPPPSLPRLCSADPPDDVCLPPDCYCERRDKSVQEVHRLCTDLLELMTCIGKHVI